MTNSITQIGDMTSSVSSVADVAIGLVITVGVVMIGYGIVKSLLKRVGK
jgi:hypothetical protein